MAEKGGWESIQKYMAQYGHKMEMAAVLSSASKYQRTEAGASSSTPLESAASSDLLSSSPPGVTGPANVVSHPPFDGDNLSELLRQETLKNERLIFQIRAFESSSVTWAAEERHLNEALRAKLDENNVLHVALKQEELKVAFISEELAEETTKLQACIDSHANAPSSPLQTRDMMVADIAPDMQLTIMEMINSMSHELLIEFYKIRM